DNINKAIASPIFFIGTSVSYLDRYTGFGITLVRLSFQILVEDVLRLAQGETGLPVEVVGAITRDARADSERFVSARRRPGLGLGDQEPPDSPAADSFGDDQGIDDGFRFIGQCLLDRDMDPADHAAVLFRNIEAVRAGGEGVKALPRLGEVEGVAQLAGQTRDLTQVLVNHRTDPQETSR